MINRRSLRTAGILPGVLLAAFLTVTPADAQAPVPLFDGTSFDGWKKVGGGATYKVEDGAIVGEVGPGSNTFLRTEKTYGDFRLELDCKLDVASNSGIQVRSHQDKNKNGTDHIFGYQCEIDPSPRAWSGGIYEEGRRGWLYSLAGRDEARKAFKLTDWNHFVIEARGPRIRTWLNGVPCADLLDTMDLEGFIALQVHAAKAGKIRWKNITIVDHGLSRWEPIFDGSTLHGWTPAGGGKWAVEKGEIHGSNVATEPRHGHLFSDATYGDFALTLKFKAERGNSGVYFRAGEGGTFGVTGVQAEIDPDKDTGGLYEVDGRGWLVEPSADDFKKFFKPGDWNELSIVAVGDRVAVHVNGQKTADVRDEKLARSGKLAFQVHGGQDVDVRFKEIRVMKDFLEPEVRVLRVDPETIPMTFDLRHASRTDERPR